MLANKMIEDLSSLPEPDKVEAMALLIEQIRRALPRNRLPAQGTLAALSQWIGTTPGLSGAATPDEWVELLREDR